MTDNDVFSEEIFKLADKIEKFIFDHIEKLKKEEYDLSYSRRVILAQRLEKIKLKILPDFRKCKYCGEQLEIGKVCFYGSEISSCTKQECRDKWCIEVHGEEGLKLRNKLNNAVSCGISSKGMHVTYKDGNEEWI